MNIKKKINKLAYDFCETSTDVVTDDAIVQHINLQLTDEEREEVFAPALKQMVNQYTRSLSGRKENVECGQMSFDLPMFINVFGGTISTSHAQLHHVDEHLSNVKTNMERVIENGNNQILNFVRVKNQMQITGARTVGDVIKVIESETT